MNESIDRMNEDILIAEITGLDWAADDAIDAGLRPSHFQMPDNRILFEGIFTQRQKGESINAVDLLEVMASSGMTMQQLVAHANRLEVARNEIRTGTSAAYYAHKVMVAWQKTQHRASVETMQHDIAHGADWQQAESRHQERLLALTKAVSGDVKTFADSAADLIQEMEGRKPPGLKTGFRDVDCHLGGLRPGNLIVVAGGTGGGKSAFGLCVALNVAQRGERVCIVSAEMSTAELHERAAAVSSSIHPYLVRNHKLDTMQKARWRAAVEQAAKLPISLIDNNRNLNSLICSIRSIHRRQRLSLVIVDYAQLLQSDGRNREREVANVSASLKGLAADLHLPVMVLAQLNRGPENREDKRPRLADLRESAALGHDADIVLMLYRPDTDDPEDRPGEVELIVRKGRSIDTGITRLIFRKEYTRFEDFTPMADYDYKWD